jgi:hypothetical protein
MAGVNADTSRLTALNFPSDDKAAPPAIPHSEGAERVLQRHFERLRLSGNQPLNRHCADIVSARSSATSRRPCPAI